VPDEQRLSGGLINEVTRVADTVRRMPPRNAAYVHALLQHFEHTGWAGAPRYLGIDDQGRVKLSFLDGVTRADRSDLAVDTESALAGVARLVREFHDLTAGTELAVEAEVVCHNDLDPRNTVYLQTADGPVPTAFIDWDIAAPGRRIHDVARIGWQYLGLGPGIQSVPEAARKLRLICDSYGLPDRGDLLDVTVWWQDRCWRGILAGADARDPAMIRIRDAGLADTVRQAAEWTSDHAAALSAELTDQASSTLGAS